MSDVNKPSSVVLDVVVTVSDAGIIPAIFEFTVACDLLTARTYVLALWNSDSRVVPKRATAFSRIISLF
jgi:hypothetical protein